MANHGGPSGDTNLSPNLTDKNFEKLATMHILVMVILHLSMKLITVKLMVTLQS